MLEALLVAAVVIGVVACPVMMWLGRRGIGPGCAMMGGCRAEPEKEESLDELRRRERELAGKIQRLEREGSASPSATSRDALSP